jgi:hypothetical protein
LLIGVVGRAEVSEKSIEMMAAVRQAFAGPSF